MAAQFCLRLAWGLIASIVVLEIGARTKGQKLDSQIHPRFFRVHFLTALALLAVAGFFLMDKMNPGLALALAASLLCCFAGSIVWHLDGAPLARPILYLAVGSMFLAMILPGQLGQKTMSEMGLSVADDVTSAALLGCATSAMLMGHSYLIAPAMSLTPLLTLLAATGVSLLLRVVLAGMGLFQWREHDPTMETEIVLWLSLRWLLGFAGVLGLGWMAWESARIRSTQSATGILYVVVIFCFLGELCSQLLLVRTGYVL